MSNSIVRDYLEALTVAKVAELQAENALPSLIRELRELRADRERLD